MVVTKQSSTKKPSDEDNISLSDYSASRGGEVSDNINDEQGDTLFRSSKVSSTEDSDVSTSSEDEENVMNNSTTTACIDPILLRIRFLLKQVRGLIGLVHISDPLSEYIREQAKKY